MNSQDRSAPAHEADTRRSLRKVCCELRDLRDLVNARVSKLLTRCEGAIEEIDRAERENGGAR
jgi:hypothetical protein